MAIWRKTGNQCKAISPWSVLFKNSQKTPPRRSPAKPDLQCHFVLSGIACAVLGRREASIVPSLKDSILFATIFCPESAHRPKSFAPTACAGGHLEDRSVVRTSGSLHVSVRVHVTCCTGHLLVGFGSWRWQQSSCPFQGHWMSLSCRIVTPSRGARPLGSPASWTGCFVVWGDTLLALRTKIVAQPVRDHRKGHK